MYRTSEWRVGNELVFRDEFVPLSGVAGTSWVYRDKFVPLSGVVGMSWFFWTGAVALRIRPAGRETFRPAGLVADSGFRGRSPLPGCKREHGLSL